MSEVAELSVQEINTPQFIDTLVSTTDIGFLDEFARKGAVAWAAVRAATILACYRQKQLYEQLRSREEAVNATGHTSWSAWITSLNLPMSDGLIRQRCVEIHGYRQHGAGWMDILNILAMCPTAGTQVLTDIVDESGNIRSHIDVEQLPGGSVEGLFEAIASIPDPGQARRLVSDASGRVAVYVTDCLIVDGRVYATAIHERPDSNDHVYLTISAHREGGEFVAMADSVSNWIVDRLGGNRL